MSSSFASSPWAGGLELARALALEMMDRSGADTPEEYAAWRRIDLRDTQLDGARGQLLAGPFGTYILLSDTLSERERRWTIAHELGHYELEHPALPAAELCTPRPRRLGGQRWQRDYEDEADEWAMFATMPEAAVASFCDRIPITLDAADQLAQSCGVPLMAAAIRLTTVTFRVCAVVLSRYGEIEWVCPSLRFLALSRDTKLAACRMVGPGSLARKFYDTGHLREKPELVPGAAWMDGLSSDASVQEHTVHLDEPGCVLTMLSTPLDFDAQRDLRLTPRAVAFTRDHLLSSDQSLDEFTKLLGTEAPCPYARTWFEALMRTGVHAAG